MTEPAPLRFDEFELDGANALLTRAGQPVALPPKAFSLLCVLAASPGKLATKDALLDAVWGHRFVSESVLKSAIAQVRAALGDDAAKPRYLETVARRGYRFIGSLRSGDSPKSAMPSGSIAGTMTTSAASPSPLIARGESLATLHARWQGAAGGERRLVWIAGDAGIGKTTLVDRFVADVGDPVARGQCVEQYGAGEPYLPVLEALKALTQRRPDIVVLMRQVAPTWLVQMPWLVDEADRAALQAAVAGAGQERMARELFELLSRVTQTEPLLLVTEDLHWSDQGTLKLMDHFARLREPMRVLWVATFRLTQVIAEEHPMQRLRRELQLHGLCDELLLDPFSESELAEYVSARSPGRPVNERFIRKLHEHTDGLPLFVVSVLADLLANEPGESAALNGVRGAGRALPVPDSLVGAVETQLAKLPPHERRLLEAASVCGVEFRGGSIAALLDCGTEEVIRGCDELVRRQYWLRETGVVDLPDGMFDTRYCFRHAVYRHAFYQRLSAAQRIEMHRRAARSFERSGVLGAPATPAELASHYELGREYRAAVENYTRAAASAHDRFASHEVIHLTDAACALLPNCPESERLELELPLRAQRGAALGTVAGIAAPDTLAEFDRVRELCDLLPETPERVLLLNSFGWRLFTRADYPGALALAQRIRAAGERFDDPVALMFGYNLMGVTCCNAGDFRESCEALRAGIEIGERLGAGSPNALYVDAYTSMHANLSIPLVQMGLADQALSSMGKALERGERLGQPLARVVAYWCACLMAVRMEDVEAADIATRKFEELAASGKAHQATAPARWFRGWVELRKGNTDEGLRLVREGQSLYEQAGTFSSLTETLSYVVEGLVPAERWDEAEAALDEADAYVERFGERLYVTELRVLESRIAMGRGDPKGARRILRSALDEPRNKGALGAELKVLLALAELPEASARDREDLREGYSRLTEGFDTPIARRIREVLASQDR